VPGPGTLRQNQSLEPTAVFPIRQQAGSSPTSSRLSSPFRGRFAPAKRGGGWLSAWLLGAPRRTTTRIKPTSAVNAFGVSVLAAYPPPR